MQEKLKNAKGITLVALIITVIILLILAGITLSLVIGENGLIAKSKQGVDKYKEKADAESKQLEEFEAEISGMSLPDDEKNPELKPMKLVLNITEDNKTIQFPVNEYNNDYNCNCEVDWGDNTVNETVTNENAKTTTHTYASIGTYIVTIEGVYEELYVAWDNECIKEGLVKVEQWGATGLKDIYIGNCTNLTEIATPSKNSFINMKDFSNTFKRCTSLIAIPENLFANCPNVTEFFDTFCSCTSLTSIPERLFVNCPNVTNFTGTFEECSSLTSIPKKLFANCLNVQSFMYTFWKCENLKGKSIQLWNEGRAGIDENNGGFGCYAQCENLDDFEEIPSYWTDYEV